MSIRPVGWLFLCWGLSVAELTMAQPLVTHPAPGESLQNKWQWGLETLAAENNDGWILWQIHVRLDEKIDPADGDNGYIRWNNRSRYVNWGGGWRNGLSLDALPAGNKRPQQDHNRELDLLVVFRVHGGETVQMVIVDPLQTMLWRDLPVAWLGEIAPPQSFAQIAAMLTPEQPRHLQRQLIRTLGLHGVANRTGYLTALYDAADWADQASYLVESLALQKSSDLETFLVNVARDENAVLTTRRVAISALSRYDSDPALDTLTALAGPLNPTGVRVEAVESLGMYGQDAVAGLLHLLVLEDQNESVQEQALGSLARLPNQFAAIAEIAHIHGNRKLRQEALEQLADRMDIDI